MNILGVSCYHHDSAAANIKDNKILGASHEERFSRNKYDNNFPIHTIDWLKNAYEDFDYAVFYEETSYKRFKRDIKKVIMVYFEGNDLWNFLDEKNNNILYVKFETRKIKNYSFFFVFAYELYAFFFFNTTK